MQKLSSHVFLLFFFLILISCRTPEPLIKEVPFQPERPFPNPIEIPAEYLQAIHKQTRTQDGQPGVKYWQQFAEYDIHARLDTDNRRVSATARITYHNNSPDTLFTLFLDLLQNHHAQGVRRNESAEITGGITLNRVVLHDNELESGGRTGDRYVVDGTRLALRTGRALFPGQKAQIEISYEFRVPQAGISGRMGYSNDNMFFIGYWYPQMVVYDDIIGWHPDPYLGRAEFYHGFANYSLAIEAPEQWVVMATGEFLNPEEVLREPIFERMQKAHASDQTVIIVSEEDLGNVTRSAGEYGYLTWRFYAENVRDVAFSATRDSYWDGARTPVGDRNGDGNIEYTKINTFWRQEAPLWRDVTEFQQHAITFLSEMTDFPYPWPHMTAVEGAGIIGGGMEFPMMTVMGDYNSLGSRRLYGVTAHELAHMWIPMIVSTDERRYSWLDEGNTSFSTNEALADFYPGTDAHATSRRTYVGFALSGGEGPMMRHSDFHYTSQAFGVASYAKPAAVLQGLRGVLGEEVFWEAYRTFVNEWAFKHAYPWDMFATFERVSGQDLSWFWRSWYYETWKMDQAIANVSEQTDAGYTIVKIKDLGDAIMPVHLTVTHQNGRESFHVGGIESWLQGKRSMEIVIPDVGLQRIEIDAPRMFPDINRRNNVWVRE